MAEYLLLSLTIGLGFTLASEVSSTPTRVWTHATALLVSVVWIAATWPMALLAALIDFMQEPPCRPQF